MDSLHQPRLSEVTSILQRAAQGDPVAAGELLPLIYEELRRLAAMKMAREQPGQTLQPTALVHEAWARLSAGSPVQVRDRGHFMALAAETMRRILIDRARRRLTREKAGFVEAETDWESKLVQQAPSEELLAVHEALDRLQSQEPLAAELVKLRYFVGMGMDEAAESMGLPLRRVERLWAFARAWLRAELASG